MSDACSRRRSAIIAPIYAHHTMEKDFARWRADVQDRPATMLHCLLREVIP